jgi:serine/threonine-protein kinase
VSPDAIRPERERPSRPPLASRGAVEAARSGADLLDARDVSHARLFAAVGVALPAGLLSVLPFLGGDPRARQQLGVCLLVAALGSAWLLLSLARSERYDVFRLLVAGGACLVAELAGLSFFGVFSPVVAVLPLGVLFFGMTRDPRAQALGFVGPSVAYFVLAISVLHRGRLEGGVVSGAPLTPAQAMVMLAVVEVVLAVTFVAARAERAGTVLALARSERTSWAVVQRDALLAELQKDLARALDVAGVGRFSETVVGDYRLGGVIGRGAMGEVYEATHVETHAEAAVKLLHTHTLREPGSLGRFLREGKMARAVDTPHAVRVLDMGGFDSELPYLAMERLRGDDLAEILRQTPRLPLRDVLRLLSEVGVGLEAARAAGVVHRDVKPRNLFLAASSGGGGATWKLLDFGVARRTSAASSAAPEPPEPPEPHGVLVGTPEYMAPEQAAGGEVSHKTDLFSLGAVVYRALTGYQAFNGDHLAEVLYEVGNAMPPRPGAIADLGPEVDLVLAVALAKAPADRFDSALELRDALRDASEGRLSADVRQRAERVLARWPWGELPQADDD